MQQRTMILALALLLTPVASLSSQSAVSQARLFLRNHVSSPAQPDELAELKGVNPEAYALVKALLTKRSLGLLNKRDPTASFAAPPKDQVSAEESGPEVFQKFASPGELAQHAARVPVASAPAEVALPYAEVEQGSSHKDFMNWKPADHSSENDEQMVQNVLGAVAELSGKKKQGLLSKSRNTEHEQSSLEADAASFNLDQPEASAAPQKPAAPPAAPAAQENSYLKNVDFGLGSPEALPKPAAASVKENSYLKGIDLTGDMPVVEAKVETAPKQTSQVQGNSYLTSFSWDDAKPQEEEQPKAAQTVLPKADAKSNSLLSWLGVEREAPQPKAAPAAPARPSNPYIMDLS